MTEAEAKTSLQAVVDACGYTRYWSKIEADFDQRAQLESFDDVCAEMEGEFRRFHFHMTRQMLP